MELTIEFFETIRERTDINLSEVIQANNFSGVVSNVFTKMLSDCSIYHSYSDQRYPDLMHAHLDIGLEVKASNKPMKGGEGHNGHSGWHIVICFEIYKGSFLSSLAIWDSWRFLMNFSVITYIFYQNCHLTFDRD